MEIEFDKDLQSYFTDVEHLRGLFKTYLESQVLPKRLIIVHGVGGVGKSSLLRMFRLYCKSEKIPVALTSGDEAKSVFDLITHWTEDLKSDKVKFSSLSKTLDSYRVIQAKVEDKAKKTQNAGNRMADIASKAVSKTAETAGGALVGAAIGSIIPGVGTAIGGALGGVVSGMGAEALTDWLRNFLSKSDIDLLLNPTERLTADFLEDIARVAGKKRLVLILDTFEQITVLENWVGNLAQKIHPNVLVIIAGRKLPDWDRVWHGWLINVQVEELKPMTEDIMRDLIHRYYATIHGGEPNPMQVDAIVRFARGLPMVVTGAVQLWAKYGVEDFQSVKAEIVANLVDRLMEGVPKTLIPALEAAAIVQWFDQPILRAVTNQEDVRDVYNELRRFPFVRTRVEGLALHDSVREMIDENLYVQDSERYIELHKHAAAYFGKRIENVVGEDAERLLLERLFHLVKSGQEIEAINESQQAINMALVLYRRVYAESILELLNKQIKQKKCRQWLVLLNYRIILFNPNIETQVSQVKALENLYGETSLDKRLKAMIAISLTETPKETSISFDKRIELLQDAVNSQQLAPSELADSFRRLGDFFWENREWNRAITQYNQVVELHKENLGLFGEMQLFGSQAYAYLLMGEWNKSVESANAAVKVARQFGGNILAGHLKTLGWALSYRGELESALDVIKESLHLAEQSEDEMNKTRIQRRLTEIYDRQGCWLLANPLYLELIARDEKYNRLVSRSSLLALLGISYRKQGALDEAEKILLESLEHIEVAVEPIALNGLGDLYLVTNNLVEAKKYFDRAVAVSRERPYYYVKASLGIVAVSAKSHDFEDTELAQEQVMRLSLTKSYNDLLSYFYVIKGHATWDITALDGNNISDSVLSYYQYALIYALRYNRFLLDEILGGYSQETLLRPLIPACLERGEDGKKILIAIRDWWKSGHNNFGSPYSDTFSVISKELPLLEAEKIARAREPGDGSVQKSVIEQIESAIKE